MAIRDTVVSRVQLALNVSDLDDAVAFHSRLFAVEPNKRRAGYANFVVADSPRKLVLFETADASARLNHLGVEVADPDEVTFPRLPGHLVCGDDVPAGRSPGACTTPARVPSSSGRARQAA